MWDLPGPGLEPVSPALAGGFLTTVSPGKSQCNSYKSSVNKRKAGRHLVPPKLVDVVIADAFKSLPIIHTRGLGIVLN